MKLQLVYRHSISPENGILEVSTLKCVFFDFWLFLRRAEVVKMMSFFYYSQMTSRGTKSHVTAKNLSQVSTVFALVQILIPE